MNHVFWGFEIALGFGALASAGVYFIEGGASAEAFLNAYFVRFNCLVSGGLIIGTAIFVYVTQTTVPSKIEATFGPESIAATDFAVQKKKFVGKRRSITFSTDFLIAGLVIFELCGFPLERVLASATGNESWRFKNRA